MNAYYRRKSIRLPYYDYSQVGLYFITICGQNRLKYFGEIENGEIILNDAGKMIEEEWFALKERFPFIVLHECVVMPNHFHAIVEISQNQMVRQINDRQPKEGQPQEIAPTVANIPLGRGKPLWLPIIRKEEKT